MSIKSQKSLNEELSEIVERSYSVRSASDESLSCGDDDALASELLRKLTPAVLSQLRRAFRYSKEREQARDIDRRVEEVMRVAAAEEGIEFAASAGAGAGAGADLLWLDERGFVAALEGIFGHHKYTPHAHQLFQLLDPFCSGRVRWGQLVSRLVTAGARRTRSRADCWVPVKEGAVQRLQHCKRETIVKLVSLERAESFCYAAVSRGGRVAVYSARLQLLHEYEVFYHRTGMSRRVKNCWITDAVYLTDVQYLILSASDRSLTMYDAATLTHTPVYCITGLPNIPTCLSYRPSSPGGSSELAAGTERGDVTRLRFLQPRVALLHAHSAEHINYYFWMELSSPPHTAYCSAVTSRRVHARSVRRVVYMRRDVLLSCSHDAVASVRARHVNGKMDDYVFKVQRGVSCFHVVPALHVLATGSADGTLRLWDTTQDRPFACLTAPGVPVAVLDVAIVAAREIVLAFCANCSLHIWDMYEECLLQTVKINFPVLGVLGKKVEFGAFCIHPGPARRTTPEEDLPADPLPVLDASRRGSSVYQGSTGGLLLQEEAEEQRDSKKLEDDFEYCRFNRPEVLVSCCDYVCCVPLGPPCPAPALPPPGDTLRARRPSCWDLPDDVFAGRSSPPSPRVPEPPLPPRRAPPPPPAHLLSPATALHHTQDLDTLLDNAGLQGILEKDFVLMYGLKHDLNRKLAELEANKEAMCWAVSARAPYLALSTARPDSRGPADLMADTYNRVMRLFPAPTPAPTPPAASEASTPRKKKN